MPRYALSLPSLLLLTLYLYLYLPSIPQLHSMVKMFEECLAKSLQEIKEYGAGVETLKTPVIWDRSAKCKALEQAKVKEQERATSLLLRHSRSLNSTQRESPGADDKNKRKTHKASSEDQTKVSIHVCPC